MLISPNRNLQHSLVKMYLVIVPVDSEARTGHSSIHSYDLARTRCRHLVKSHHCIVGADSPRVSVLGLYLGNGSYRDAVKIALSYKLQKRRHETMMHVGLVISL